MSDAAPSAGAAAEEQKPLLRRLRRPPTALLVTLLGIALTAWLLPAVSRQWDDRQKAQQLKTRVGSEMASGTARALIGGEALTAGRKIDRTRILDAWEVESLTLETRLRAYFGNKIVTAWEIYSWLVDRYDGGHRAEAKAALLSAARPPIHLNPG